MLNITGRLRLVGVRTPVPAANLCHSILPYTSTSNISTSATTRLQSSSTRYRAAKLPPVDGYAAGPTPVAEDAEPPATAYELKLAAAKQQLRWRQPYGERKGEWYSKFKVFASEKNEADNDMIAFMQQPLDFSLEARRVKREKKRVADERFMQQFVAERHRILGNDLAAAHFLVHRGGSVKFTNSPRWIRREPANIDKDLPEYTLPSKYDPTFKLEAIRCDDMELYYEGLENVRRLQHLKFLSFHAVRPFDDWCLDRVSGSEFAALEVLDVSGTQVTERGLAALYRVPTLRVLIVDNAQASRAYELTCAMLEELMPELKVVNADTVHDDVGLAE